MEHTGFINNPDGTYTLDLAEGDKFIIDEMYYDDRKAVYVKYSSESEKSFDKDSDFSELSNVRDLMVVSDIDASIAITAERIRCFRGKPNTETEINYINALAALTAARYAIRPIDTKIEPNNLLCRDVYKTLKAVFVDFPKT
ncbi:MAG: hypothetical protein LUC97_10270 [Clostridiales bacterium]|nr:hypothetical protein [Clostridiales bacterium]